MGSGLSQLTFRPSTTRPPAALQGQTSSRARPPYSDLAVPRPGNVSPLGSPSFRHPPASPRPRPPGRAAARPSPASSGLAPLRRRRVVGAARRGGPSPVRQRTLALVGEGGAVSSVSSRTHFRATATPHPTPKRGRRRPHARPPPSSLTSSSLPIPARDGPVRVSPPAPRFLRRRRPPPQEVGVPVNMHSSRMPGTTAPSASPPRRLTTWLRVDRTECRTVLPAGRGMY